MNNTATHAQIHHAEGENHISLFYETPEQRLKFLANYLQVGFAKNEQCILVTDQQRVDVVANLLSVGLDIRHHLKAGGLRIFNARKEYLTNSNFVVDYVMANVRSFLNEAESHGYRGLRTAGEIRWPSGDSAEGLTGICLYPIDGASIASLKSAMRTHPEQMFDGNHHQNPSYFQADQSAETASSSRVLNQPLWMNNLDASESDLAPKARELSNKAIKKLLLYAGHP